MTQGTFGDGSYLGFGGTDPNAFHQGGDSFGALAVLGTADAFDLSFIRGAVEVCRVGAGFFGVNATAQSFLSERLHVADSYLATSTSKATQVQSVDITGGSSAPFGSFSGEECDFNISGAAALATAAVVARAVFLAHYSTAPGPFLFTGHYSQVGAGDFTGAVAPVVGSLPTAWAYTAQVAFGTVTTAHIDDGAGVHVLAPFDAAAVVRTITACRGVHVENQGAVGITDAVAIDIDAQSGASGLNLGIRNRAAQDVIGMAAPPAPPAGTIRLYVDAADGILKAKGPSGLVTVLALP